VFKLLGYINNK